MLRNYIKIAIRNVMRHPSYSFINIGGLAVGLASCILILLWVADELSYDRFHKNANELSQVWVNATFDGTVNSFNSVPYPTYQALRTEDSRIKNTCVTNWGGTSLLTVGETRLNKNSYYVTEEFLEMFQFPLIKGDVQTVLDDPQAIVLTEATAEAMFGKENPLGQIIRVDNSLDLKVTGILRNIPTNSSFEFDCLISHKQLEMQPFFRDEGASWDNYSFQVYAEIQPGANKQDVENSIKDILVKNGQVDVPREFFLHALTDWRLYSVFTNGKISGGRMDYVQGFSLIALLVLIIACINFMNLATARSERRAREVGVRKSVGSRRHELVFQFLGESLLITAFAFIIAMLLVELVLPLYNDLTAKKLFLNYMSPTFWLTSAALIIVIGLLSGSYPALYLSSFNPVKVLKGKLNVGRSATTPRQVLVVVQFLFSIVLIISTFVIAEQINHVKRRDLGYDQQNLITVPFTEEIGKNFKVIRQELVSTGAVSSITKSNSPITEVYANNFMSWPGKPEDQKVMFITIATEQDYTKTMGIKVLEGRDFIDDRDTTSVLVNKAAAELMGLESTVGARVGYWGDDNRATIVGVIDDVTMNSPYREAAPMFITYMPSWANAVTIRLEPTSDLPGAIAKVEQVFKKHNPAYPFEYTFVDQEFAKKFSTINLISTLSKMFAVLAIIITGLGLFGLASFTAEQRTKEIGIRKVMGASVSGLVSLISKEFTWLVVIAFTVAAPVTWWLMANVFLTRYAYRIDFPWWTLALGGALTLIFALAIVGTQAWKAASANPVNALRSE
jgi:putative ABC transport system permease protein